MADDRGCDALALVAALPTAGLPAAAAARVTTVTVDAGGQLT